MRSEKRSLRAYLRGGVAALTTLSIILVPVLAGAQSYHGEKAAKAGAAPTVVARPYVATPLGANDNNTTTPIKHVIIIVGENRSFDHVFATYVPPSGDRIINILLGRASSMPMARRARTSPGAVQKTGFRHDDVQRQPDDRRPL